MLWWRGLRSRPVVDLLLTALAALAVATAVMGPLLVRAVEQSTVSDTPAVAGDDTALGIYSSGSVNEDILPRVNGTEAALSLVRDGPAAGLWERLQQWTETTANVAWQCDTGSRTFETVGVYDPTRVATPLTRPGAEVAGTSVATGDPLVVIDTQVQNLPLPTQVSAQLRLRQPVTLADLPLLRTSVEELDQGVSAQDLTLIVDTRLPDALDRVASQSTAAVVLVAVVEAQAIGLALFAVVVVLARVGRARGAEWSAGRLLGVPRPRWFRSVYVEPGVALLLGVPIGWAAAVAVAGAAVRAGLRPWTPFERRPLAELVAERSGLVVAVVAVSAETRRVAVR